MGRAHPPTVEVDTLADFDRLIRGRESAAGWHFTGLDLREREAALGAVRVPGALFLGCTLTDEQTARIRAEGGIVFPRLDGVPVDIYRSTLYTATDLYAPLTERGDYAMSLDARAYAWSREPEDPAHALARSLHDHAIDQALEEWNGSGPAARRLVGVMGGHALGRDTTGYAEAARLGRALADPAGPGGPEVSLTLATGGGPGAMEAANLGAWMAAHPAEALPEALALLARVPDFRPDIGAWARAGFAVRDRWTEGRESLAIPTWHYGHEPPNVFGTAIAKYFRNAIREAVLLEICTAGIVFLPGAGGTVQEIFADACENYYAEPSQVAPMILFGRKHWSEDLPAWQLLRSLARGKPMEESIHLVDDLDEAVALLRG